MSSRGSGTAPRRSARTCATVPPRAGPPSWAPSPPRARTSAWGAGPRTSGSSVIPRPPRRRWSHPRTAPVGAARRVAGAQGMVS
ncbi:hypothetical protein [Ornithinimicrobium kibberense]|uniref:hypothetical protein n=1 Tax=Ornithinimicrobium kibberense TaxID=282060 RepID=UPI00360DCA5D